MDTCKNCSTGHAFREHAVPCGVCRKPGWRHDARCDKHTEHPTR